MKTWILFTIICITQHNRKCIVSCIGLVLDSRIPLTSSRCTSTRCKSGLNSRIGSSLNIMYKTRNFELILEFFLWFGKREAIFTIWRWKLKILIQYDTIAHWTECNDPTNKYFNVVFQTNLMICLGLVILLLAFVFKTCKMNCIILQDLEKNIKNQYL